MSEEHEIAYTALVRGTRVLTVDGAVIGTVEQVLEIPDLDLFDGIVVETPQGARFVDSDQISRISTSAVYSVLTTSEAAALSPPDGAPTYRAKPPRRTGGPLTAGIKRLFGRAKWVHDRDDE